MTLSQEPALCIKSNFEDVHPFEQSNNHRSHQDQIFPEQYSTQHQASQNPSISNGTYEATHMQEFAQTMYYDHSDFSNSYLHSIPHPNFLHLQHHNHNGAFYGPQALQMAPGMMYSHQMYPSWQGDWQAVSSQSHDAFAAGVPVDRPSEQMLSSQEHVYSLGYKQDEALTETQSNAAVEKSFVTGKVQDETEENLSDPIRENTSDLQVEHPTRETTFVPKPVLAVNRPYTGYHEVVEPVREVSQEDSGRAAAHVGDVRRMDPNNVKPALDPVVDRHRQSVQYPSLVRTEIPGRNLLFVLASDPVTEEVGWFLEGQSYRFQTSPCLDGNVSFPIRPLGSGILAGIHNDWLGEFPEPPEMMNGGASPIQSKPYKRFPTASSTFESHHVRSLWQELERRRILEMNDAHHLHRLRHEAVMMLKYEAIQQRGRNGSNLKASEPTEEEIDARSQLLWDQSKRSAIYAVGLLRQAEYCIAQGHLGFVPLQHPLQAMPTAAAPKRSRKRNQREPNQSEEGVVLGAASKRKSRSNESLSRQDSAE